jgi:hypothetical protein
VAAPGLLDFSIIRGIQFDQVILQCRDDKLVVSGDAFLNVLGVYTPSGTFGGEDLYIKAGDPVWFIYFHAGLGTYIIAQLLTTGTVTDYFGPSVGLFTDEPTGPYVGVGANTGALTADDNPVDLTGFSAEAKVRRSEKIGSEVVLDFAPVITNFAFGEITIPAISKDDTEAIPIVGEFRWDLVLVNTGSGERFGPFARGRTIVSDNITSTLIT